MALIKSKPTSPGRRFRIKITNPDLYKVNLVKHWFQNQRDPAEGITKVELQLAILVVDIKENIGL